MGNFEDELWTDLLQAHGDGLANAQRPTPRRSRTLRPITLTAGVAGVVGAGTVLALTLTATTSVPAYAVTENSDGTVSVTIHDISGVTGANAKLAALGVRARAVTPRPDCTEVEHPDPTHTMLNTDVLVGSAKGNGPEGVAANIAEGLAEGRVIIRPSAIPVGDTLTLTAKDFADGSGVFIVGFVRDPAPSCVKEDLQPVHVAPISITPSDIVGVPSPIPTS